MVEHHAASICSIPQICEEWIGAGLRGGFPSISRTFSPTLQLAACAGLYSAIELDVNLSSALFSIGQPVPDIWGLRRARVRYGIDPVMRIVDDQPKPGQNREAEITGNDVGFGSCQGVPARMPRA